MDPPFLIPPGASSGSIRTPSRNASRTPTGTGGSRPSTIALSADNESTYSTSTSTSYIEPDDATASETSSITGSDDGVGLVRLVEQLGRLYMENTDEDTSSYTLPVDGREQERLDIQDIVLKALIGKHNHPPLEHPGRILDIGTGTGTWAEDIALKYPDAEVVATDLYSIISQYKEFPPNVKFFIEDATNSDWGPTPFSYIHTRMMLGCFADFKEIIQRSFDYLEPGGWMESVELDSKLFCGDNTVTPDNPLLEWGKLQMDAQNILGRPIRIANKLKKWYEDCGFIDVREEIYSLPINGWPKDPRLKCLGRVWAKQLSVGLSAFSLRPFQAAFGWDQNTTEVAIVNAKNSINDKNIHAYHKIYAVWGRKPLNTPMKTLPLVDPATTPTG